MIANSSFCAPFALANPHVQTLLPLLYRYMPLPSHHWQTIPTADGDFIDLVWFRPAIEEKKTSQTPLLLLLHGLEGSLHSPYVRLLLRQLSYHSIPVVFMHFRGCSGRHNRLHYNYHSGETADLHWVLQHLRHCYAERKIIVAGFSLGANVLLKYSGEQGQQSLLDAAVAVSVPFDLAASANRLRQGMSRLYECFLLHSLIKRLRAKYRNTPVPLVLDRLSANMGFYAFDNAITARLHGFVDADEYYRLSSSRQFLSAIQRPTLILQAKDDPFVAEDSIPTMQELSSQVRLELSAHGGHVGFVSWLNGRFYFWLSQRICEFVLNEQ